MRPDDLLALLRAAPFEAFRIYLSDGAAFEIRHPDMAIVQRSKAPVAVPGVEGPDGPADRTVNCSLTHVTQTAQIGG
jgi:hypothetical protein